MPRIEQINDLETAREVAKLLEKENARLHARLEALVLEVAALRGESGKKQYEIEIVRLQEQMAALQRKLFAASSEKQSKAKDDAAERSKPEAPTSRREQKTLPIEPVEHSLDAADMPCAACGNALCEWSGQEETTEEIDVVERQFVIKRHIRKKYRCACGAAPVLADGPLRMPGGGLYSLDFAIQVAFSKYGLHLPLERQAWWMVQQGIDMSSSTLWDQLEKARTCIVVVI